MNTKFKRNLLISSVVSILILLLSSTASFISIRMLMSSNAAVFHTQQVIFNLNEATAVMLDAQSGMRGFLITGNDENLARYVGSEQQAALYLKRVAELVQNDPEQKARLAKVLPVKEALFEYIDFQIAGRRAGVVIGPNDLHVGKSYMDKIRNVIRDMESHEQTLLAQGADESKKYGLYSILLIVVAALIAVTISAIFFRRIYREFQQRSLLQQELAVKDQETANRITVISGIAGRIADGDYTVRATTHDSDALGSIGGSLNNMAEALERSFGKLSDKEWLQAGVAELNKAMIGEKSPEELANAVVEFVAEYTESSSAIMYLAEGNQLQAIAGFCYTPDDNRDRLQFGHGISGQAAASKKMIELTALESEDIVISYAQGKVKPRHILALPLLDGKVTGVLELMTMEEFTDLDRDYLLAVSNNISVAMTAAINRARIQELLDETQAQSEELQVQHSELESINAELEAQTEKLQASEEELRVQQEELQQINEELSERSVMLEEKNREVQKKSEDLEQSTRYKSEFLANMSHELRTPLNSILLLSRLLSENNDGNMNNEQTEFARVIQSSGNGLLTLIDEILDLSKIEAGKMEVDLNEINVNDLTSGLKDIFLPMAKEKNILFNVQDADSPKLISSDRMRLDQILKNLISNAIKFTSQGSVDLKIFKDKSDPKFIRFAVTDTGIGIPADKQPLIFEAFQQADGSTKRKYGGTGLGLSISRQLAKLLGGEILLDSAVGEGSTFTLRIPATGVAEMSPGDSPATTEMPARTEPTRKYISEKIPKALNDDRDVINGGDKIVLIVEDDINFAKSLLEFARQKGYKAVMTVRGDEALALALQFKPAGILLDVELPVMNGWEVMEELKGNPETRHIPVHIMSSHSVRQESLLKGAVNFLNKPVAFEQMPEIFKQIERIVNRDSGKVLILEDNQKHAKALSFFLESYNINSEISSAVADSVKALASNDVDCVILDMGVPAGNAYEILEQVKSTHGLENLPVIVFTGKSLSVREEQKIKKYADSIVVKTAHSYQRMLDEVSLFMHLVENKKDKKDGLNDALQNMLKGKTVLIVDDDVRNIYSLTKALETLQMNVLTAIDGREAVKILNQNPATDIVLLDMMMPNMDGYETAATIRADDRYKKLPVIAVTAKAMTGDREKCINAGASDYITKPVDIDQLLSLLRVWLYDSN